MGVDTQNLNEKNWKYKVEKLEEVIKKISLAQSKITRAALILNEQLPVVLSFVHPATARTLSQQIARLMVIHSELHNLKICVGIDIKRMREERERRNSEGAIE